MAELRHDEPATEGRASLEGAEARTGAEALMSAEARAAAELPQAPSAAPELPLDPAIARVELAPAMGIDGAGPWQVGPDAPVHLGRHVVIGGVDGKRRDGVRRLEVVVDGWRFLLDVGSERAARLRERARRGRPDAAHGGPLDVRAIIPGRIVAVAVAEGDAVEAGQQLLVIEAMKMQNELRSPRAGTIERIAVGAGQAVEQGALLLVLR